MTFVQIVDFETSRYEELQRVIDSWLEKSQGNRTAVRSVTGRDRENPQHFMTLVEFPSYEDAMMNSKLPATEEMAGKFRELCSRGPDFRNLDVIREESL
jgi:hypothetical protein